MRYRCTLCEKANRDPTSVTKHVSEEHQRQNFGWFVERVPDSHSELATAWVSNGPIRARHWLCGPAE